MKKTLCLLLLLAVLLSVCSLAQAQTTTTVLMYMCGTDLQSDCVTDLYEMCTQPLPDSVTVVVEAGGATQWDDRDLTPNAINRFTIEDQTFSPVQTVRGNMGDQKTLYDFLAWAVPNHPADRYVLILWDHGGGSDSGICFDETADFDSLSIHEVYSALYDYMQKDEMFHLDILGCDACLMATYEMAAHMCWFADYMVASEELEPYLGWNYEGWLSALADDPDMDSQSLAVAIADSYMKACMADDPYSYYSLSVVYLPAMFKLVEYMETYSAYLAQALDNGQLASISRARQRMYSFGTFSKGSSTNMVDMMSFLDATRSIAPNQAQKVEDAYKRAVRYNVGTDTFDYLTGMSILLPADNLTDFMKKFKEFYDCSENIPNYTQFAYGYASLCSGSDYRFTMETPAQLDSEQAVQSVFTGNTSATVMPSSSYVAQQDSSVDPTEEDEDVTADLPDVEPAVFAFDGVIMGGITPTQQTEQTEQTEQEDEPLTEMTNGDTVYACSMTLSADEIANLSLAEGVLYMDASDEEDTIYIEMGVMQNVRINWDTGEIVSGFDGTWPLLDEQLVTMYDLIVTSSMRRSVIPAICNGEEGYLLMTFNKAHPEGVLVGFSTGVDEQGIPVRGAVKLEEGDEVIPTYIGLYEDEDGELIDFEYEGDPIIVSENGTIPFEFLPLEGGETNYMYCFCLTDIFGEEQLSDFISFML